MMTSLVNRKQHATNPVSKSNQVQHLADVHSRVERVPGVDHDVALAHAHLPGQHIHLRVPIIAMDQSQAFVQCYGSKRERERHFEPCSCHKGGELQICIFLG